MITKSLDWRQAGILVIALTGGGLACYIGYVVSSEMVKAMLTLWG